MELEDLSNDDKLPAIGYVCAQCGRMIGGAEQPYQWGNAIVCAECCSDLQSASSVTPVYNCGNCGRRIGAMEQPYAWGDGVVCPACCGILQSAVALQAAAMRRSETRSDSPARQFRASGLGVAALVLGLLGTALFWVPPLALMLGLVGLVLGVVGIFARDNQTGSGLLVAGILMSLAPLAIYLAIFIGLVAMVKNASSKAGVASPTNPAAQPSDSP